jgi:hypothetical protein
MVSRTETKVEIRAQIALLRDEGNDIPSQRRCTRISNLTAAC